MGDRIPFLLGVLWTMPAFADWALLGAAIQCDTKRQRFELAPVVELSSQDPGEVTVQPGFEALPRGITTTTCQLRTLRVAATLRVFGPDNGHCMGAGYVDIQELKVGKVSWPISPPGKSFNWNCDDRDDPTILMKVVIQNTRKGPKIETCTAQAWEWGSGFIGTKCKSQYIR